MYTIFLCTVGHSLHNPGTLAEVEKWSIHTVQKSWCCPLLSICETTDVNLQLPVLHVCHIYPLQLRYYSVLFTEFVLVKTPTYSTKNSVFMNIIHKVFF